MVKLRVVGLIAAIVMGLGAAANGAVIFQDDFSDGPSSDENWTSSNDTYIKRAFTKGECVVTNSSTDASGFVYHALPSKKTTFTVSTKITRSVTTGFAGLAVGLNTNTAKFDNVTFLLSGNNVYMGKSTDTSLAGYPCSFVDEKVNTLTVSMNGTVCNVFVNNHFLTTVDCKSLPGGDVAFLVYPGVTISYDDFMMTDAFTSGSIPTSFTDDFESSSLKKDWTLFSKSGTATVGNGKLNIKTANDTGTYAIMLVDVDITDFTGKVAFSHKSGSTANIYGLRLEGDGDNQFASFAITAGKYYGVNSGAGQITFATKQSIRGAAYIDENGVITYRTDTLEIIKRPGSEYIFVANRDTLTRFTGINYPITKVGIFCQDSLDLIVDDFRFKPIPDTVPDVSVRKPFVKNDNLKVNYSIYRGSFIFDPLGRSILANRAINNRISSGVYFTKGLQKSQTMMIIKDQK